LVNAAFIVATSVCIASGFADGEVNTVPSVDPNAPFITCHINGVTASINSIALRLEGSNGKFNSPSRPDLAGPNRPPRPFRHAFITRGRRVSNVSRSRFGAAIPCIADGTDAGAVPETVATFALIALSYITFTFQLVETSSTPGSKFTFFAASTVELIID
jgi:hypothetical protein